MNARLVKEITDKYIEMYNECPDIEFYREYICVGNIMIPVSVLTKYKMLDDLVKFIHDNVKEVR